MKGKILIVDDDEHLRLLLSQILSDAGYEIVGEGINAEEAISLYKAEKPDLVTLDVLMYAKGENTADINKSLLALRDILAYDHDAKVIMMTGISEAEIVDDFMKEGALGYIAKPFLEEKVLETVAEVLQDNLKE